MEEVVSPQASQTIELNSEENQREVNLSLTVGQIKVITALIEQNIQPKGYEMIKIVYELFERLKIPELFPEDEGKDKAKEEAFE